MKNIIQKAETYCRTMRHCTEEYKEAMLYAKYGGVLGILTCKKIAEEN